MRPFVLFIIGVPVYLLAIAGIGIGFDFNSTLSVRSLHADPEICEQQVVPLQCRQGPLSMQSSPEEYMEYFGASDAGSYVRGAIALVETDAPFREWSRNGNSSWPPGMFFLNGTALLFDLPLGVVQWFFAGTLWAIALSLIGCSLAIRLGNALWMLAPMPFLLLPMFSSNFLHFGIVMSEASASALFAIGLALISFPVEFGRRKFLLWLLAGAVFAGATLMRAQVLYITMFLLLGFLVLAIVARIARGVAKGQLRPALGLFLGFFMGMVPWIHVNGELYNVDYAYSLPFIVEEFPDAGARNWLALGGIRSACIVDETRCMTIRDGFEAGILTYDEMRTEILRSFILNPVEFISHKLPILAKYFMADNRYPSATVYQEMSFLNLLYVAIFLISVTSLILQRDLNGYAVALLLILLLFSIAAPPFLIHYEVRYLYLAKVLMLMSPIIALGRHDIFSLKEA